MKILVLILSLFTFGIFAQTKQEQSVFNNKIWKVVSVSQHEKSFYDVNNVFIGSSVEKSNEIIFKDKWKRTIKVVRKYGVQPKVKPVAVSKKSSTPKRRSKRANQIIVRKNKATYYNAKGNVLRFAKRRGKKVFFHGADGKLIGYKIYNSNGTITYKDARGRISGSSYIDKTGRMIYRAKNRKRRTPKVLFDDPFLFST